MGKKDQMTADHLWKGLIKKECCVRFGVTQWVTHMWFSLHIFLNRKLKIKGQGKIMQSTCRQFIYSPTDQSLDQSWEWKMRKQESIRVDRNAEKRADKNFTSVYQELSSRAETLLLNEVLITSCICSHHGTA